MNAWTRPTFCRLPARELLDPAVEVEVEPLARARRRAPCRHSAQVREETEQLAAGHPLVQAEVARQVPEPLANRDAVASRVEPEDAQPAARRADQVEQEADRRRLACAVRPEEPEYLAGLDREVDVDDPAVRPVVLGQLLRADDLGHAESITASGGSRYLHAQPADLRGPIRGECGDELPAVRAVARDERVLRALDLDVVRMRRVADELQPEPELIGPEERRLLR